MATSVTVNLSHIFMVCLDLIYCVIIAQNYCEYQFWCAVDTKHFTQGQPCID